MPLCRWYKELIGPSLLVRYGTLTQENVFTFSGGTYTRYTLLPLTGYVLPPVGWTRLSGCGMPPPGASNLRTFVLIYHSRHMESVPLFSTCTALLQGHTALVCQVQLSPTVLATGGSDGRVITFCLQTFSALHRIDAHESSVTSLQCDPRFLVTGGNDGRARLFEMETGRYVRELSERSESVWKVVHRGDVCAVMCKRAGKTVMEIWNFGAHGPIEGQ
jgi:WD40 repeat protein